MNNKREVSAPQNRDAMNSEFGDLGTWLTNNQTSEIRSYV